MHISYEALAEKGHTSIHTQVPLSEVLDMCGPSSATGAGFGVCSWAASDLSARLQEVAGALGLTVDETRWGRLALR